MTKGIPKLNSFDEIPNESFIRKRYLLESGLVPFSSSTLWRKVNSGDFPAPVKISDGIVAWRVSDVRQWQASPSSYAERQRLGILKNNQNPSKPTTELRNGRLAGGG
jgi:prophage regulatory protein